MNHHVESHGDRAAPPPGPPRSCLSPLQRIARLGLAAGVALVAACGGGSGGGSVAPPPPEASAYDAQTSVKLAFAASATGAGAAPLRFELAAAPDGVLIDPQTGSVEWVPQPEQLGDHTIAVAVTDASGAVTTRSYRISVAAPAGQAAYLVLRTDATGYTQGQPIAASWRVGGELPAGASIQLRVSAPAVDASAVNPSQLDWMLDAQGAWSNTPVKLQDAARSGQARLTLPSVLSGHWLIETLLIDETGATLASAARRVLVSDAPAMRLLLNRPIANPLDRVAVGLDLAAGANPLPTRLVAWMVGPDGRVLGLPGLSPTDLEVQRGEVDSGTYTLLDREFTADEAGEYRVHGRLYAAADGRMLQEASARFTVCTGAGEVTGRVSTPDRSALDGVAAALATVRALDVDDLAVTASAAISAQGEYTLSLAPGRYLLLARAIDAAGTRLESDSQPITVACSASRASRDFSLRTR